MFSRSTWRRFPALAAAMTLTVIPVAAQSKVSLLEAVTTTLSNNPNIEIQREEIAAGRGLMLQASSQFDRILSLGVSQDRASMPLTSSNQITFGRVAVSQDSNTTRLGAGMTWQLRNGMTLEALTSGGRLTDNVANFGTNRSSTVIRLKAPLLGGRGREIVTAAETAAGIEVEARQFDLSQMLALSISNTVRSYWALVSAKRLLQVTVDSEKRGMQLRDDTLALIEADLSPRNEIYNLTANLAARTTARIAAELAVLNARKQLAVDMGIRVQDVNDLPDASDDFPDVPAEDAIVLDGAAQRRYIEEAFRRRPEVLGARRRQTAAGVSMTAAQNLFRPRLDLSVSLGYSGLREGVTPERMLTPFILGGHGPDAQLGISYSVPQNRLYAQGRFLESKAASRQAALRTGEAERLAAADTVQAIQAVQNALQQVRSATISVEQSKQALDGEREKQQLGSGSVVELLTIEDRLTSSLTQLVNAQLRYPLAVIQLRFATGTLVEAGATTQSISTGTLTELPNTARR